MDTTAFLTIVLAYENKAHYSGKQNTTTFSLMFSFIFTVYANLKLRANIY